ncbi:hypothetical protein TNCT_711651 [Trichonephila clavata]|uniref:Uncharacterized protein n=1 Tax=Trichonephila clavata TaxID=2740835 RepID=A0A8X6FF37_TRICU|nr:hypothetical protein TNCT_711651 [Trichonephila clavata]
MCDQVVLQSLDLAYPRTPDTETVSLNLLLVGTIPSQRPSATASLTVCTRALRSLQTTRKVGSRSATSIPPFSWYNPE